MTEAVETKILELLAKSDRKTPAIIDACWGVGASEIVVQDALKKLRQENKINLGFFNSWSLVMPVKSSNIGMIQAPDYGQMFHQLTKRIEALEKQVQDLTDERLKKP